MSAIGASAQTERSARRLPLSAGVLAATIFVLAAQPAAAHVFVHLGFGLPVFVGPPVFSGPPVYYAPPPAYYYPPPVQYEPPPANAAPAGGAAQSGAYSSAYCREYQTTARINGALQKTYGTACRQPDGSWRIVN